MVAGLIVLVERFKRYWRGSFGIVEDDQACVVRSRFDAKRKIARMDVTIFSFERLSWTRSDLSLFERSYAAGEVVSALRRAGFVKVRRYDAQKDLGLEDVGRTFFVGERSK